MRAFVLILLSFGLLSCNARHIDYTQGSGPQGGPGYRPSKPDGSYELEAVVGLRSDRLQQPDRKWPFSLRVSCGYEETEIQIFSDPETGAIFDSSYPGWKIGQSKCLELSCQSIEIQMSGLSVSAGTNCSVDLGGIRFQSRAKTGCSVSGRFAGESAQVWAEGILSEIQVTEAANKQVFADSVRAELETRAELAPINIPTTTLRGTVDGARALFLSLRLPTQTRKGSIVNFLTGLEGDAFKDLGHGHFGGALRYWDTKTGESKMAELDFSCR